MKFVAECTNQCMISMREVSQVSVPEDVRATIENMHVKRAHLLKNVNVDDPLQGRVLRVKIPYRYRRVMCSVEGRPIQSLVRGDEIEVVVDFKGAWNVENHCGFSWVLSSSTFSSSSSEA